MTHFKWTTCAFLVLLTAVVAGGSGEDSRTPGRLPQRSSTESPLRRAPQHSASPATIGRIPPTGLRVMNSLHVDWRNDRGTRERDAGRLVGPVPSRFDAGAVASLDPPVCRLPNCSFDIECDDGDPCTDDRCDLSPGQGPCAGICAHDPVPNGSPGECDDGVFCNGRETCQSGVCAGGVPAECCSGDVVTQCAELLPRCSGDSANAGAACEESGDCAGGTCDRCRPVCQVDADCNDGVNCNGVETCHQAAGLCRRGVNPCGLNATCFEGDCSDDPGFDDPCNTDFDCATQTSGTCEKTTSFCRAGRCCLPFTNDSGEIQPTCAHKSLLDCSDDDPNSQWYPGDHGSLSPADQFLKCGGVDGTNQSTDAWGCPKYGRGITMHNAATQPVYPVTIGPVSNAPAVAGPTPPGGPGGLLYAIGDDYTLVNSSHIGLDVLRFVGGVLTEGGYLSIDFYDNASPPNFIEDIVLGPLAPGIGVQVIVFLPSLTIPPSGHVVLRVAEDHDPNTRFVWSSTTAGTGTQQGTNLANRLWVNKAPANATWLGQPQILAMELVGDKENAPTGACCQSGTGECSDGVISWICRADPNNTFHGPGSRCATCNTGPQIGQNCRRCVGGARHGLACNCDTGCAPLDCPGGGCNPTAPGVVCMGTGCTAGNVGAPCTLGMDDQCDVIGGCNGVQCTAGNVGVACTIVGLDPACDIQGTCGTAACSELLCATGACCNPSTGACTETAGPGPCTGSFQGYGTGCDADPPGSNGDSAEQHCCPQPQSQRCMGGPNNDQPCFSSTDCGRCVGRCADDGEVVCDNHAGCPNSSCLSANLGNACSSDAQCSAGFENGTCTNGVCDGGLRAGLACATNLDCQGSVCDGRCVTRWSGADDCEDSRVHVITVPDPGQPPKVITISGDNSFATSTFAHPDTCFEPSLDANADPGQWEAFSVDKCAYLRIDFCCSDPVRQPQWDFIVDDCQSGCNSIVEPRPNPHRPEQAATSRGAPYCSEDNVWQTYGPLQPGTYWIPIYSALAGAHGLYQMHVTVEACPLAACCYVECTAGVRDGLSCGQSCPDGACNATGICVGGSRNGAICDCPSGSCDSKCGELNQKDCDAKGGFSLQPPQVYGINGAPFCEPGLCDQGSCCSLADECSDAREAGGGLPGTPMTKALCDDPFHGFFVGGAECKGGVCADPPSAGLSCSVATECAGATTCIGTPAERNQPSPCGGCYCPPQANAGRIDVPVVLVTNRTGVAAADLHVTFADTGGSLNALFSLVDAPGCSGGGVIVPGGSNTVILVWNEECVPPGATVSFVPGTNNGPLEFCCGFWSNAAGRRIGAVARQDVAFGRELDVDINALGRLRQDNVTNIQPIQVPGALDAVGNRVAFSFGFRLGNPDPDGPGPMRATSIPWAWPVKETAATPWVVANGGVFSGASEFLNHAHDRLLDATAMDGEGYYGPHPHCQLYVFKQPGGAGPLELIGCSDLKHHFATVHGEGETAHFIDQGEEDTYGKCNPPACPLDSNQDRNFFGVITDMDADFKVAHHDHLGFRVMVGRKPLVERGFAVYERDHGEPQHMAANDLFRHRLQAAIHNMLAVNEIGPNGMPGNQPLGTKWYFAASIFVHDPSLNGGKGGKENNRTNNTVFREFKPGWNGTNFAPAWDGDSKRLKDDGAFSTFVEVTEPGLFYGPAYHPQCIAPKKQTDCGNGVLDIGEDCDFQNDAACPGLCGQPGGDPSDDCQCPIAVCGNDVLENGEECESAADCQSGACRAVGDPLGECTCACPPLAPPPPTPTTDCTLGTGGDCRTRSLTFTMVPPATASSGDGTSAIKITSVDLYHQVPVNPPSRTQPNFSTFDTVLNNACTGAPPAFPRGGYYCQTTVDCQPQPGDPAGSTGTCPTGVGCTAVGETGGCARWVGPPFRYLESRDSPSLGSYLASRTQCAPYYQVWDGIEITVLGTEILPSSTYDVIAYGADCKGNEGGCTNVSATVQMKTRRGGDVFSPFNPPSTSPQPEGPDVAAVVNKFKNLPGSIVKAIAQVQSNFPIPTNDVDGTDIAVVVDAVKGFAYGFSGPCICPSTVPCDTTVCSSNGQCAGAPGNYGTGAQCVRECQLGSPRVGEPCTESVGDPPIPDLDCGSCSAGSPNPGIPCDANSDCSPGTCATGVCGAGGPATTGFCRDRCGRCN